MCFGCVPLVEPARKHQERGFRRRTALHAKAENTSRSHVAVDSEDGMLRRHLWRKVLIQDGRVSLRIRSRGRKRTGGGGWLHTETNCSPVVKRKESSTAETHSKVPGRSKAEESVTVSVH